MEFAQPTTKNQKIESPSSSSHEHTLQQRNVLMDDLTDDLLCEILSRLPIETLKKLRLMNKRLHHLISQPHFILTQAQKSTQNVLGLFHITKSDGKVSYVPLNGHGDCQPPNINLSGKRLFRVCGSHRGLVLCYLPGYPEDLYLYNPTTKMELRLDNFEWYDYVLTHGYGLIVNLMEASDNVVWQFKIACVYDDSENQGVYRFGIYSSNTGKWRVSHETICYDRTQLVTTFGAVYFDGALHWLAEDGNIITFDVEKERAGTMRLPVPMSLSGSYSNVLLTAAENSMNLVRVVGDKIELWSLEGCQEKVWKMKCSGIFKNVEGSVRNLVPVFYNADQVVLGVYLVTKASKFELFTYNFKNRSQNLIGKLEFWMDKCRSFFPYISNMVGQGTLG